MKKIIYLLLAIAFGQFAIAATPFITTWNTVNVSAGSSNSTSITIPTPTNGNAYNYDVDWNNDGTYDQFGVAGSVTHDYGTAGTYTVAIRGSFPQICFNNAGDKFKILSIEQWGSNVWANMGSAFYGCSNLIGNASDVPNLTNVTDMSSMFNTATIFNQDISTWNVSNVTNMALMFAYAHYFNQNIGGWNVSNVTDMSFMFYDASAFNGSIGNWNVGKVTNMFRMFQFSGFNRSIGNWNVAAATNMVHMFYLASSMSRHNYDATLIAWNIAGFTNKNLGDASPLKYCAGSAARASLISKGWSIINDALLCTCTPITSTINTNICPSALPYSWNDLTFTAAGSQTTLLTNSLDCDSLITLNLTIKATSTSSTNTNICQTALPYIWNGLTFLTAGTKTAHLANSVGCDSAATLTLTVSPLATPIIVITTTSPTTICSNINGGTYIEFQSSIVNGGLSPVFQWKKNGVNVAVNVPNGAYLTAYGDYAAFLPTSLVTNDVISCTLTANNFCQTTATANSNAITMTIKPAPPIGTTLVSGGAMCTIGGTTIANNTNTSGGGVWSSSNPSIASIVTNSGATGTVTALANGTATLTYTKTLNGCTSTSNTTITVASVASPAAITGLGSVCVGSSIALSTTSTGGVWSSVAGRATVNAAGLVTATSAGTASIKYTVRNAVGCSSFVNKIVTVNAIPSTPSISYAPGTTGNPQAGAPTGNFCVGKKFSVVGVPTGGHWSYTNGTAATIFDSLVSNNNWWGTVKIVGFGAGSITYIYTNVNGCSNRRTMSGNGYICFSSLHRGTIGNEQLAMNSEFTMYPNPAKSVININVETLIGKGSIVVTDLYGKTVKTQPLSMGTNTVDIANLSKGMYFVSTITTEGKNTKKLVLE